MECTSLLAFLATFEQLLLGLKSVLVVNPKLAIKANFGKFGAIHYIFFVLIIVFDMQNVPSNVTLVTWHG